MTTLPQTTDKKLGLVIDLDTCVGCHACVVSCKGWNTENYGAPLSDQDAYGADPSGTFLNRVHSYEVTPEVGPAQLIHFPKSCLHCDDAPCVTACPTDIDIPLFIRQISTGTPEAAAKTIFDMNILGGMCARVCPTEELCEQACVRELAEGKPVEIGRLQRHATDTLMAQHVHPYSRATSTGKVVAVVGGGPAGLSCAHRLAVLGSNVTIYDARPKAGGLNEYGIAAYKSTNEFAAKEIEWLLSIGGITIENNKALGKNINLDDLGRDFDAVFLGVGLGGVNALNIKGSDKSGVSDAVTFIEILRQTSDFSTIPIIVESENTETIEALLTVAKRLTNNTHVLTAAQKKALHISAIGINNFTYFILSKSKEYCNINNLNFSILKPLLKQTIESFSNEEKPLQKQTGPARRGDLTIIENHIEALSGDKEFQALYKDLSQYILSEFHGEKYKL